LARKVWHNLTCLHGYTWDMPNIMRGDVDTGERTFGNDYYQDMMLWSLPAALDAVDLSVPTKPGGLVDRVKRAAAPALISATILPALRAETPETLPDPAAIASAVPAPLYRDPVYDGAADPVVVWNAPQQVWNIFYTQRRARLNLPGVEWGHGTEIGVAESRNE